MDWINIDDRWPEKYQDVIICSNEGIVKPALHMGGGKFSTYVRVNYWMPYPSAPDCVDKVVVEEPKKRRGRPKKQ